MLRILVRRARTTLSHLQNLPNVTSQSNVLGVSPASEYLHLVSRSYSKDKNRKKENKKQGKVEINEDLLKTHLDYDKMTSQMEKTLEEMKANFIKNLSLRSTTGAIETLPVNVDGSEHELQELGQIVRKNPKTIVVNMIAFPQTIPAVLLALQKSGMNLSPQQDGTTIFIPVPKVTKEHRENLTKSAKTLFLKCRDGIKGVQQDHIKRLKRQAGISSDDVHSLQAQITAIADKFIGQAERTLETKQQELSSSGD